MDPFVFGQFYQSRILNGWDINETEQAYADELSSNPETTDMFNYGRASVYT